MSGHEKSSNLVWHNATLTRDRREQLNGHRGGLFWFTGLSGVGKLTLAHSVEVSLFDYITVATKNGGLASAV